MIPRHLPGGRSDALTAERASATPATGSLKAARNHRGPRPSSLTDHLTWFQDAVVHPRAPAAGGILTFPERLDIYRQAYRMRLADAVAEDFPAVRTMAGPRWDGLVLRYLRDCPPQDPTLNAYGRRFPEWLATHRHVVLSELARLEWALVEVLHAPPSPLLDHAALARLPLEDWASARFTAAGTLRIIVSPWPIDELVDTLRTGEKPLRVRPRWSATAVYRHGWELWRQPLDARAWRVLDQLCRGRSLNHALQGLQAHDVQRILPWFQDWASHGFFSAVRIARRY